MEARIYYLSRLRPSVSGRTARTEKEERIRQGLADWVLFREYWKDNDSPSVLAERMDITGDELSGFIRDSFAEKYMTIRRELRIGDACEIMLEHPEVPIHLVGKMVGISDKSDFRKAFVTEKGCTPSLWKKYGGRMGLMRISALLDKARNHFRSLRKP